MRIQCPECRQRFDVTKDFMGKTVECGSCDHQFKVTDDVLVTEKKRFYPGEKTGSHLERFGRNKPAAVSSVGFTEAHYQANDHAERVGPPRPRRTVAMVLGVSLMTIVIVVFLLAGGKEGAMRDMETGRRFILVIFTAVLGGLLVLYGSVQNRRMGVMLAMIFGLVLLLLPILFPGNPTSASEEPIELVDSAGEGAGANAAGARQAKEDYLFELGYDPVSDALAKHPEGTVVAVFIRNASETVRGKIAAYLYEATDKVSRETLYKRGDSGEHGLILLVGQKKSIDEIAALCAKFGRIEKISKELRVIDVMVEGSKMVKLDLYKALNPDSLDFQQQNLNALRSIDPKERINAVKRLADAEPKARRHDIVEQLIKMLPQSNTEMQLEIIKTLRRWSKPGEGAEPVVLEAVQGIHKRGKLSKSAMEFLVERQVQGSEVILMELWESEPVIWADVVMMLGEGAQVLFLPKLGEMDVALLASATDILGQVAGKEAIPLMEEVMKAKEGQAKKSLQAAIDEINKRF